MNEAYNQYLSKYLGLRFTLKEEIIPNIEMKIAKTEPEKLALEGPITVNKKKILLI